MRFRSYAIQAAQVAQSEFSQLTACDLYLDKLRLRVDTYQHNGFMQC